MIDGIPVNDMENGWVYWSNWFGLDAVTSNVQVQRGLEPLRLLSFSWRNYEYFNTWKWQ